MPLLLAFDTAGPNCSVALSDDGKIRSHRHEPMTRGQAEALFPMIQTVLAEANTGYGDLDGIAVTIGPGSFTGLRIGLAAARGIILATSIPACGVTSFEALIHGMPEPGATGRDILVALESKRADPYVQLFSAAGDPLSAPEARLPEQVPKMIGDGSVMVVGDGAPRLISVLDSVGVDYRLGVAPVSIDARSIAAFAELTWPPSAVAGVLEPLYLRPPDTTKQDGTPSRSG